METPSTLQDAIIFFSDTDRCFECVLASLLVAELSLHGEVLKTVIRKNGWSLLA